MGRLVYSDDDGVLSIDAILQKHENKKCHKSQVRNILSMSVKERFALVEFLCVGGLKQIEKGSKMFRG